MTQFFVDFDLPETFSSEFVRLIPAQRRKVNELLNDGVILSYALSADRTKVWATINARSGQEVDAILEQLPLSPYMVATIHLLEFYNATGNGLPAISLN